MKIKIKCPDCNRKLNWLSKEGTVTVATLQHDRSGDFNILCLSCNSRHASFKDDSFYESDKNKKVCPCCEKSLSLDNFGIDNASRWKNKNTYCRSCRNKMHKKWVKNNKEKCNEKRREYYHKRKDSGNPIPR